MKILLQNGLVVTGNKQKSIYENSDIIINNNKIEYIGPSKHYDNLNFDKKIDCTNKIVIPGLINAHTHTQTTIAKGILEKDFHALFMWKNMASTSLRTPEEVYYSTLASCIEMIRGGTTCILDHFSEQTFTKEMVDAAVKAFSDLGMRAVLALRIYDGEYSDIIPRDIESLPNELRNLIDISPLRAPKTEDVLDITSWAIEKWNNPEGLISVIPGPSAPLRCSDDLLIGVKEISERYNVGIHTHLLESSIQAKISKERYGKTMVGHLDDLNILSPKLSCAHTIWVTDDDIKLLAAKGVSVVHNPTSNLRLGAGFAPILKMKKAGVNIAIATDGASTNDNLSMLEALKTAAIIHRPFEKDREQWLSAEDVFYSGTVAAAKVCGFDSRVGSLEIGKEADITIFNMDTVAFKPLQDPLRQLIYSANGQEADTVIVKGNIILEDGRFININEDEILEKTIEASVRLKQDNKKWFSLAEKITPYLINDQLEK